MKLVLGKNRHISFSLYSEHCPILLLVGVICNEKPERRAKRVEA